MTAPTFSFFLMTVNMAELEISSWLLLSDSLLRDLSKIMTTKKMTTHEARLSFNFYSGAGGHEGELLYLLYNVVIVFSNPAGDLSLGFSVGTWSHQAGGAR